MAISDTVLAREEALPLLSVRNLRTYFHPDEGVVKAVDGATFDVDRGRTLGIVGESGCGKSVAARSILRIVERPGRIDGGEIIWRGRKTDGNRTEVDLVQLDPTGPEIRSIRGAEISLVFQEPMTSFSPVHTIGDQIGESLSLHRRVGRRDLPDRVVELLRHVGIPRAEQRVDEYPYQLSGGLRQRAMIAMALACEPRLLIADEPTTALDVTTQAQILDLLRRLQSESQMAIMLITHNLGVVAEMAEDVVVMYLGRVVERGPVDAIFGDPKHPYTQALLRSVPTVEAPARRKLPTLSGSIPHPYNRPSGCPFHTRCPEFIQGVCDQSEPRPTTVGANHEASCFLYDDGLKGPA
jgi:oligopeptide/dipeptide ABC transporter ATP-binding protein